MKKIITLVLVLTLCTAFCGCAQQSSESSPESSQQSSAAEKSDEESRKAEQSKAAEESRKAEQSKAAEESRKAEQSKAAEESRKAEESKAAEESRKAEESKAAEESRKAEESKATEESRKAEESKAAEESRRAQESKQAEESRSSQQSSTEQSSQTQQQSSARTTPHPTSGNRADVSWFDDAVFVGDSVTLKLSYYADGGALGNAEFLCAGSLGYNNALWDIDHPDNVHPLYKGRKVTVDDGLAKIGRNKIIIMLGMNDIGLYGVSGAIDGMKKLTDRIEAKCPDAQIYIESVTPMLEECQLRDLNNTTIRQFDEQVERVCNQKGYIYLDIASAVDDGYGNLISGYCSDPGAMGLHFSDAGCAAWVERLKETVM